ncbi:key family protein [Megaselia abdita]
MSDDESFVVLGTSPFNSLKIKSPEQPSLMDDIQSNINEKEKSNETSIRSNGTSILSNGTSILSKSSMAASFLLGEVQPEMLKESVYSQFPSLNESMRSAEDISKLQNLITSNIEMKEILRKTNETMSEWMSKTKTSMDTYKTQIQKCQEEIGQLRNENQLLQTQLSEKIKHIELMEQIRTQENEQLRMGISEKNSLIANMQTKIITLEEQQLQSYDLLKENQTASLANDYVPVPIHKKIVDDLQSSMDSILAENLEIKGMQKQYLDEINCLKVNLVSLEELHMKAKSDLQLLQSNEATKSEAFVEYENKIKNIQEEMTILRIQVDTYQKDFESERTSRQSMAGERDNLLVELKKLQNSNQQLMEEAKSNVTKKTTPKKVEVKKTETPKQTPLKASSQIYERVVYSCPLCGVEHRTLGSLQNHVQACLDDNN